MVKYTKFAFFLLLFTALSMRLEAQTFVIANKTGLTVTTIYVSAINTNSWGSNINTKDQLLNGEFIEITPILDKTRCKYDLKFTADDGKNYVMKDLDLCSGATVNLQKTFDKEQNKMNK